MKKVFLNLGLACMAVAIFASCSNDEKQMKAAVENYMNAMFVFDFEKAQQYATPESASMLSLMAQLSGMQKPEDASKDKEKNAGNTIHFVKVEKSSDSTGLVTFEVMNPNNKEEQKDQDAQTLDLKKRGGKWLVHQTKETPQGLDSEEDDIEEIDTVEEDIVVVEPTPEAAKKK